LAEVNNLEKIHIGERQNLTLRHQSNQKLQETSIANYTSCLISEYEFQCEQETKRTNAEIFYLNERCALAVAEARSMLNLRQTLLYDCLGRDLKCHTDKAANVIKMMEEHHKTMVKEMDKGQRLEMCALKSLHVATNKYRRGDVVDEVSDAAGDDDDSPDEVPPPPTRRRANKVQFNVYANEPPNNSPDTTDSERHDSCTPETPQTTPDYEDIAESPLL
jgi:hypothetical protein